MIDERFLSEDEEIVRAFRPHWKVLIVPILVFDLIVAVGVVIAVTTAIAAWLAIAGAIVIGLILVARPILRWFFTSYVITTERLVTRSGIMARQGKELPLEVINDVTFSQTVGERILRSGDLLIESAGEMGQSRYRDVPHPDEIQALVYRLREDRIRALSGGRSAASELETLARLHRDGVITDAEFEAKKRSLMDEI